MTETSHFRYETEHAVCRQVGWWTSCSNRLWGSAQDPPEMEGSNPQGHRTPWHTKSNPVDGWHTGCSGGGDVAFGYRHLVLIVGDVVKGNAYLPDHLWAGAGFGEWVYEELTNINARHGAPAGTLTLY